MTHERAVRVHGFSFFCGRVRWRWTGNFAGVAAVDVCVCAAGKLCGRCGGGRGCFA